jgi:glutamyl-tRNA synthetase/glutamyl-Q tRNA(Asp) synthetase
MIVSRFAPAPTGFLHLGHIVNALYVWGITRTLEGRVLLRIEDHDRQRSRAEYESALLDDLEWLGFVPDSPSIEQFRRGRCEGRQRDRQAVYQHALERLANAGLVYACDCTRRDLRRAMDGLPPELTDAADSELRYSGRCAGRGLEWGEGLGLRVRLEPSIERFNDLRHGPQEQRPSEQSGDLLIRDREGNWTYQFAVTVDDLDQGVNLVIRGDDLMQSTGRQIQLARLLGRAEPPRFLHHPLIMKSAGQKLSKADRDTSVRDLRLAGLTPEHVFGRALEAIGLATSASPTTRDVAQSLVVRQFSLAL